MDVVFENTAREQLFYLPTVQQHKHTTNQHRPLLVSDYDLTSDSEERCLFVCFDFDLRQIGWRRFRGIGETIVLAKTASHS